MNEKILIIEDDEAIVNVLRRSLQYEKYLVSAASDGESGLKAFRENKPDLVILDWMLPMMDGLEVCQRIRAFSDTPILMLTAKDTLQDRVKGLDVGADDYLVKPFQLEELLARIRALLRRLQQEKTAVLPYGDLSLDTV
ncbi:MAG TPA: response regulator transcription factor, partial [Bellilinea sp.]|nr:response regulator transcription factor [Bellilinea sp.]